jgi:tRNA-intron endonuclease
MGRNKREQKLKEVEELIEKKEITDAEADGLSALPKDVRGRLIDDKVVIEEDFNNALEFYDKGCFGEIHGVKNKVLELALVEALYLVERKKLTVTDGKNKAIKFEDLLSKAIKLEDNFWTRWRVFRDFRTRGYVLKTTLKFGADFRVYRRGMKPGDDHAQWVLYCVSEGQTESWRSFAAKMRVAHSTRKTLLIGCVDDEGDCCYWEVRWRRP